MEQILINGVYHKLASNTKVIQRAISPWKAKVLSGGSREFSDFSEADIEEYHDLRGGVGLESDLPDQSNRLHWTEGVDFSTPRSAVLGPLVTTAGSFGVAPVRIIDFQGNTYAIGASLIAKWNAGTPAWDSKDTSMAAPIDALVVTDTTDEYFIVSSATAAIYSTDGTTWNTLTDAIGGYMASFAGRLWFISTDGKTVQYSALNNIDNFDDQWTSPTGFDDPAALWTNEAFAYDKITGDDLNESFAEASSNNRTLFLTVPSGRYDRIRYFAAINGGSGDKTITIKAFYRGAWTQVSTGVMTEDAWTTVTLSAFETITAVSIQLTRGGGSTAWEVYEVAIGAKQQFELSGDFGNVYKLFEGKLLSDGSPALYFLSNRGLFTIDVNNEKAYKQEVEYPPLTYAGHAGLYWNANVWIATGYGILKVAPSIATNIGPNEDDGLPSGYQGTVYDMDTVNNWLVFCVNGGSTDKSSILKRNATLGGNLQVYTGATNKPIACIHHSPSSQYTNGRLWFGEDTDIKYMMFPDVTHNVKQIATYEYGDTSLLENGSFEAGDPPASWTLVGGSATVSRSSAQAKIGTYSALLTRNGADCHIYQGYSGYAGYASKTVTLGCWVYATVAARAGIGLGDGQDSASSTLHTGVAGWEWLTVSLTVDATPTYLRSYLEIVDGNTSAYFDGATLIDNETNANLPILRKLAMVSKTALGVAAITKSCDNDDYINIYYGLNGAAPTTLLGAFKTSPRPTLLPFNSGLGTAFYRIQLAFKLIRGSTNTNSPELESLVFYYIATPAVISSWTFEILALEEDAEEKIAAFETLRDTKTLVLFYPSGDSAQSSYNVKLSQMPLRFVVSEQQTRRGSISVTVQQIFEG